MLAYRTLCSLVLLIAVGCAPIATVMLAPPTLAAEVQSGVVKRKKIRDACVLKQTYVNAGVTDPSTLPVEVRAIVQQAFDLCDSIVDLNAVVGGEPTNAQIKTAITTIVAARAEWEANDRQGFPDPAGFTFTRATLPGNCDAIAGCATTGGALCGLVQAAPTIEKAENNAVTSVCDLECLIDEADGGGKLWMRVNCQ